MNIIDAVSPVSSLLFNTDTYHTRDRLWSGILVSGRRAYVVLHISIPGPAFSGPAFFGSAFSRSAFLASPYRRRFLIPGFIPDHGPIRVIWLQQNRWKVVHESKWLFVLPM